MNIFYYHGLDSILSQAKRAVLEKYGNVIAPSFDYRNIPVEDLLTKVIDIQFNQDCDLTIGSSLGGLLAYTAAALKDLPCLLFNPALYANPLNWQKDEIADESFYTGPRTKLAYIVLGEKDTVVDYKQNLKFIEVNIEAPKTLISVPDLEHRIPLSVFEYQVASFMQTIDPAFMLWE